MSPKPRSSKRPTMKDIALQCGISQMAVSMALRSDPQIPPATRERVLKAASALHYVPSLSAQHLKSGKSGRIAYVAARLAHQFVGQILAGVEQRSFETKRYFNAVLPYSTWFLIEEREKILRQILYGGVADAVILVSMLPGEALAQEFRRHRVPLVLIETKAALCHSVCVDNELGSKLAVDHLVKSGCKNIGLIVGELPPKGVETNATTMERRKGFADTLKSHGRKSDPSMIASVRYFDFQEGPACLDQLLAANPKLDGIFCAAGDRVAMGVMKRARELKIHIPKDLKLIGFDDLLSSALLSPALSTIRQPVELLGSEAFDLALRALDNPELNEETVMHKPELILRETA